MALLYPPFDIINNLKVQPTEGERILLNFLVENLNDEFEVYFQPFLNGDTPDIIVVRKRYGILIIEVKDWSLSNYYIENENIWHLKKDNTSIRSPFTQVTGYKDNIYNLHSDVLFEKKFKNPKHYGLISCGVYFHKEKESAVLEFLKSRVISAENKNYIKHLSYYCIMGHDSLNCDSFVAYLSHNTRLFNYSELFTEDIYQSIRRYLKPPYHRIEDGIPIQYSPAQAELCISKENARQKIKGVAGSGKTLVLAKRAVNAHKRTQDKILILTYNLTLKNYIHDKINDVRENFSWDCFIIDNYHNFFTKQANNFSLLIEDLSDYYKIDFFLKSIPESYKFQTILIDEVQDYHESWIKIIQTSFLARNGEFVVFGDEKQNIYKLPLDQNREPKISGIPGAWIKKLNKPYRFAGKIASFAKDFQIKTLKEKYNIDEYELAYQQEIDESPSRIEYQFLDRDTTPEEVCDVIFKIIRKYEIHSSDVAILNSKIDFNRQVDYTIRNQIRENTLSTFETQECYNKVKGDNFNHSSFSLDEQMEEIRRSKKCNFWHKSGVVKLSTIHSFKGWEIHTLFLIIEDEYNEKEFSTAELIYTGITRARFNLFILNLGNQKYHKIFTEIIQ
jgi:hypothetical protein